MNMMTMAMMEEAARESWEEQLAGGPRNETPANQHQKSLKKGTSAFRLKSLSTYPQSPLRHGG